MNSVVQFEKLTATNYSTWMNHVKGHLMTKELWRYVNGTIVMPKLKDEKGAPNDVAVDAWKIKDEAALGFIFTSVSTSQHQFINECTTSASAWEILKNEHMASRPAQISTVVKRLVCTKYDEKEGMESFLQKYSEIFNTLTEFKMPIHESVLCMCILMLQGLPKSYDAFVTAIESRDEVFLSFHC